MEDEIRLDVANEINESSMEKRSWIVEIREELSNMESIPEKEKQTVESKKCIYKIPPNIRRNFDADEYEPKKVSFGPYHHGHDSCKQTQQLKKHVVLHSLKRHNKTIDDYVKALSEVVQDLKDAYDELDSKWRDDDDDFLQLMIYDGCFILELLYDRSSSGSPVWDIDGIRLEELIEYYRHDMMLLENQIPMFVLERLVAARDNMTLEESVLRLEALQWELHGRIFGFIYRGKRILTRRRDAYLHVLDLCRHCFLSEELSAPLTLSRKVCLSCISFLGEVHDESTLDKPSPSRCLYRIIYCLLSPMALVYLIVSRVRSQRLMPRSWLRRFSINIPSATELEKVGIGIATIETMNLTDISFGRRTLTVPSIFMDRTSRSRILNMIAFEQVHEHAEKEILSHYYFLSRLAQSADDVRLLQSCGIIRGPLFVNEVAEFFNSLVKGHVNDPENFLLYRYQYEAAKLTKSYYKMNHPLQKDLWKNYLKSPLGVFSLIAAFLLFTLTAIQTVYTVLGYYNPK